MTPLNTDNAPITRLAIGGVVAVIVLNLLVRSFVKLGGVLSTLLVAALVAGGMALWFYLQHQRRPLPSERRKLLALYGGILALLYLGLLGMMWLKDEPGPMGLLIFGLHYFCYPLFAWLILAKTFGKCSE
jgi:peptidoglycan biosynthesis protein MviN/MurJ (putative lipid II flippase)